MSVYEFLLSASLVFLALYILCYLFLVDADTVLTVCDWFGRPVSCFEGKVVWVTGASSGLGEAMAQELASVGAKLILSARSTNLLEKNKENCLERSCGKLEKPDILVLPFDICDCEAQKTAVEKAIKHFGRIDVLVNNAGRYQIGSITDTKPEVVKDLFDVNYFGSTHLAKLVLEHFVQRKKGHILAVSSIAGKTGYPAIAAYSATKHALKGFYESLRYEYHSQNIGVTVVFPGIFSSSIFNQTMGTEKGEIFEKDYKHYECAQLTSERVAHLSLVAAANKLFEGWIAYQPYLLTLWTAQYLPLLDKYIMMRLYTKKRVDYLLKGMYPTDVPVWRPIVQLEKWHKQLTQ